MTDEAKHWFTARKGSTLAWWYDGVLPMGIIEAHPDHPPIMHWLGGPSEELKATDSGAVIIYAPNRHVIISSGIGTEIEP